MNGVMLILGGFPFMLSTAPFQTLARQSGWEWPEQKRIGTTPALQYTGKQAESITLSGMLCPELTGDRSTLSALRLLANTGKPLPLIAGTGLFLGIWVIEDISTTEENFFWDGVPRKMDFTIKLKKYAEGYGALTSALGRLSGLAQLFG